jgi:hypothetical protein
VATRPAHSTSAILVWATASASVGLALKSLWCNPWLAFGVLLDVAVLAVALTGSPALA